MARSRGWWWVITTTRGVGGCAGDLRRRIRAAERADVGGDRGGKDALALVDPGDVEGEGGEGEHQGAADVAGPEQPDGAPGVAEPFDDDAAVPDFDRGAAGRGAVAGFRAGGEGSFGGRWVRSPVRVALFDDPFDRPRADPPAGPERAGGFARGQGADLIPSITVEDLGQQSHASAAALPEVGAEREAVEGRGRRLPRERVARRAERAPFELAAADRTPEAAVRPDHQAGAGLARRGTAHPRDGHERASPLRPDHLLDRRPHPHRLNLRPALGFPASSPMPSSGDDLRQDLRIGARRRGGGAPRFMSFRAPSVRVRPRPASRPPRAGSPPASRGRRGAARAPARGSRPRG